MRQHTLQMKPIPPSPPPEPNVFYYGETVTEVEEYYVIPHGGGVLLDDEAEDYDVLHERPSAKEITTRIFYCEFAEFDQRGYCIGGCDSDADKAYCMDIQKINRKEDVDGS